MGRHTGDVHSVRTSDHGPHAVDGRELYCPRIMVSPQPKSRWVGAPICSSIVGASLATADLFGVWCINLVGSPKSRDILKLSYTISATLDGKLEVHVTGNC